MKYKLIKEYPGSPELGQIALPYTDYKNQVVHYIVDRNDKKDCDYIALKIKWVENQPEYWEEINDYYWYVVFEEDFYGFKPWIPHLIETAFVYKNKFKTKEEAEDFILNNKPCLTYKEVKKIFGEESEKRKIISKLSELIKSKL